MVTSEQHLRDIRERIPSGPTSNHKSLWWACAWDLRSSRGAEWLEWSEQGEDGADKSEQGCEWAGTQITATRGGLLLPGRWAASRGRAEADTI